MTHDKKCCGLPMLERKGIAMTTHAINFTAAEVRAVLIAGVLLLCGCASPTGINPLPVQRTDDLQKCERCGDVATENVSEVADEFNWRCPACVPRDVIPKLKRKPKRLSVQVAKSCQAENYYFRNHRVYVADDKTETQISRLTSVGACAFTNHQNPCCIIKVSHDRNRPGIDGRIQRDEIDEAGNKRDARDTVRPWHPRGSRDAAAAKPCLLPPQGNAARVRDASGDIVRDGVAMPHGRCREEEGGREEGSEGRTAMKLSIINRLGWPDWLVSPICKWIADRAEIRHDYAVTLVKSIHTMAGRGNGRASRCRLNPSAKVSPLNPYTTKYWRYAWSPEYQLRSRLELLVDIVSHEMYHATGGHPRLWRKPDGRCNTSGMELACERFSKATVEAFREWWPTMQPKIAASAKRQAERAATRKVMRVAKRTDPAPKLTKAQDQLATWTRRAKLAATKIKKYRRRVAYYSQRTERIAADRST